MPRIRTEKQKKATAKRLASKRKPRLGEKPKGIGFSLLELVLASLGEKFPEDHTMPSLILSKLKSGEYYVSLARYDGSYGAGKKIMFSAKSSVSLHDALAQVIEFWLKYINPGASAIEQLKRL